MPHGQKKKNRGNTATNSIKNVKNGPYLKKSLYKEENQKTEGNVSMWNTVPSCLQPSQADRELGLNLYH